MTQTGSLSRIPSRQTLGELPARVVVFLRATATHSAIRAALKKEGFREQDQREGLALLTAVCAWGDDGVDPGDDLPAREAGAELALWGRDHLTRLRVAVERLHPSKVQLFAGIDAGEHEASAVLAVATLLGRIAKLEQSSVAVANADAGNDGIAALETLARRGLGPSERARLAAVVSTAQSAPTPTSVGPARSPREEEHIALYHWYLDWTATARVAVRRKDWLRALGLTRRAMPSSATG